MNEPKRVYKSDIKYKITLNEEQKEAKKKAWPKTFAFPKAFSGKWWLICMLRIQKFF